MELVEGMLLRIYIGEADRHDGKPLYQWLVDEAHERGLAGVTVLRGLEGFGAASQIHTARVLRLSTDLPLVVEIADSAGALEPFVDMLNELMPGGMITLEKVRMRQSRRSVKH